MGLTFVYKDEGSGGILDVENTRRQRTIYRKILIALEGKETDEAVLTHVKTLAARIKSGVTLLRVITVADDGGDGMGYQWQLEVGSSGWRRKNQAETCLSQLERRLRQQGLRVDTALVIGSRSEADEIVSYAAGNNCDLIAMASTLVQAVDQRQSGQ
jgi:nucleotide-binding universal stress UspA family protein